MAGDIGFDPLCLTALSWPSFKEMGTALFSHDLLSSATARQQLLLEMTPEEQEEAEETINVDYDGTELEIGFI